MRPGLAWPGEPAGGAEPARGVGGRTGPDQAGPPGGRGRGAGRGLQGRGLGRGRGRTGGGRSGGLGAGVPPYLGTSRGVSRPEMHGRGRISRTLAPRGVRWRSATPTPTTPRRRPGRSPPPHAAKVLRSCDPAGSPQAVPTRWAPAGAFSGPGKGPPPRLPVHRRAPWEPLGPRGQRLQPGLESRPRPGCLGRASPPSPLGERLIPALHFLPLP